MATKNKVQDTHISAELKSLHNSLISIVSVMNRPRNDIRLIEAAGVELDQALFRLLVVIERLGPIGVVDLAERLGRDYTTISRQVAKLAAMELVTRRDSEHDRRVREATITPKGKVMTDRLDAARERIGRQLLQSWAPQEVTELVRLMAKFASAFEGVEREL